MGLSVFDRVGLGLVVAWCTAAGNAGTFFVSPGGNNANTGTSPAQAWSTLQFAADRVTAGDTVNVLPGNYVGFDLRNSGTAMDPILFLAQPGAVIDDVNLVTLRDGINLEDASHVAIPVIGWHGGCARAQRAVALAVAVSCQRTVSCQPHAG